MPGFRAEPRYAVGHGPVAVVVALRDACLSDSALCGLWIRSKLTRLAGDLGLGTVAMLTWVFRALSEGAHRA
jgi:hypothetical protein